MRSWFCLALFAMLLPFGLPALTAADGPGSLASIRATYRRPAAIPVTSLSTATCNEFRWATAAAWYFSDIGALRASETRV